MIMSLLKARRICMKRVIRDNERTVGDRRSVGRSFVRCLLAYNPYSLYTTHPTAPVHYPHPCSTPVAFLSVSFILIRGKS